MPVAEPEAQTTTRETFNRPPRIWPSFPQGKVVIPAPPERDALPPKQSNITLVMPLIMMALMVGIYYLAGQDFSTANDIFAAHAGLLSHVAFDEHGNDCSENKTGQATMEAG